MTPLRIRRTRFQLAVDGLAIVGLATVATALVAAPAVLIAIRAWEAWDQARNRKATT